MDSLWTTNLDARVVRIEPYDEAGVVVVTTDDDRLHCLDATSGHRRWTTEATRVGDVDETAVYLHSGGVVLALDAQTGDRLWRYVDAQDVTDLVTTGEAVGVRTYEFSTEPDEDHFTVLEAETGSELASTVDECRSSFEADGELYLVTYDEVQRYEPTRGLVTLSVPGDSGSVSTIETDVSNLYLGYEAVQTGTVAIDKQTGVQRFQTGGHTNDICLADTTLFTAMGTRDESAAVDVETGNELWTLDDGENFTHHVDTDDDTAYFETDIFGESTARITAVSREWGTRQWTWETDAASGVTVADGTVLVETDGVVALDAASGDQRWHSETMGRLEVVNDEVYVLDNQRLTNSTPGPVAQSGRSPPTSGPPTRTCTRSVTILSPRTPIPRPVRSRPRRRSSTLPTTIARRVVATRRCSRRARRRVQRSPTVQRVGPTSLASRTPSSVRSVEPTSTGEREIEPPQSSVPHSGQNDTDPYSRRSTPQPGQWFSSEASSPLPANTLVSRGASASPSASVAVSAPVASSPVNTFVPLSAVGSVSVAVVSAPVVVESVVSVTRLPELDPSTRVGSSSTAVYRLLGEPPDDSSTAVLSPSTIESTSTSPGPSTWTSTFESASVRTSTETDRLVLVWWLETAAPETGIRSTSVLTPDSLTVASICGATTAVLFAPVNSRVREPSPSTNSAAFAPLTVIVTDCRVGISHVTDVFAPDTSTSCSTTPKSRSTLRPSIVIIRRNWSTDPHKRVAVPDNDIHTGLRSES